MNLRSVESRLAKLEARQSVHGEYLLVWRNANEPEAIAAGTHASRARKIICVEWFGEGPLPEPRWLKGGRHRDLPEHEWRSVDEALRRRVALYPERVEPDIREREQMVQMSDNELLYHIFGVTVQ
jgi:hypothetical protein